MEFKSPYVHAMRDQAPKMLNQLVRSGQIDSHLQEMSTKAHRMLKELTAGAPKDSGGVTEQPYRREAEEQVRATLIDFPSQDETPTAA